MFRRKLQTKHEIPLDRATGQALDSCRYRAAAYFLASAPGLRIWWADNRPCLRLRSTTRSE